MMGESHARYVYEFVGGKADGKFLVVNHEVREFLVPMVQVTEVFADEVGLSSPPVPHRYIVTRPAAKFTIAPEIAMQSEFEAWCIEQAKDAAAYGELRLAP